MIDNNYIDHVTCSSCKAAVQKPVEVLPCKSFSTVATVLFPSLPLLPSPALVALILMNPLLKRCREDDQ